MTAIAFALAPSALADPGLLGGVTQPAAQTVAQATAPITDTVAQAAAPVAPVVQTAAAATTPVTQAASPATTAVGQAVAGVTTPAAQAVAPVVTPVAQTVAPVVAPVVKAVEPVARAVEPVVAPVASTIAPVTEPVTTAFSPVVEPVVAPLATVTAPVTRHVAPQARDDDPDTADFALATARQDVGAVATTSAPVDLTPAALTPPVRRDAARPSSRGRGSGTPLPGVGVPAAMQSPGALGHVLPAFGDSVAVPGSPSTSSRPDRDTSSPAPVPVPRVPFSPVGGWGLAAPWTGGGSAPVTAVLLAALLLALPPLIRRLLPVGDRVWTPVALSVSASPG